MGGEKNDLLYECGGTLINTWSVLTAAHCHTGNTKIVQVVLGKWDVIANPDCPPEAGGCDNPRVQRQEVAKVIFHTGYNKKAWTNDIALIRMKREAQLNIFVQFACLPLPGNKFPEYFQNPEFNKATIVGWGANSNKQKTKEDRIRFGLGTQKLQRGQVPIQPMSKCRKAYPRKEIQSSQLCAGGDKSNTDSCRGDSGGGLFVHSNDYPGQNQGNVHVQVGVVSYGKRLCGDSPAVYTKVDQFVPWIRETIGV